MDNSISDQISEQETQKISKNVYQPQHYQSRSGQSVMDVIEDFDLQNNFYIANAVKYLFRCGKKNGNPEKQEIAKAIWYLKRYIEFMDKRGAENQCK